MTQIFDKNYEFEICGDSIQGYSKYDTIFISCKLDGSNFAWYTFSSFGEKKYKNVAGNEKQLMDGINTYLRDNGYQEITSIQTSEAYEPQSGYTDGEREYLANCL